MSPGCRPAGLADGLPSSPGSPIGGWRFAPTTWFPRSPPGRKWGGGVSPLPPCSPRPPRTGRGALGVGGAVFSTTPRGGFSYWGLLTTPHGKKPPPPPPPPPGPPAPPPPGAGFGGP